MSHHVTPATFTAPALHAAIMAAQALAPEHCPHEALRRHLATLRDTLSQPYGHQLDDCTDVDHNHNGSGTPSQETFATHFATLRRAFDARHSELVAHITTPERLRIQTGPRSSLMVRNTQASLARIAAHVKAQPALYGGGRVTSATRKPTRATTWPARAVSLVRELIEDRQHADALRLAEERCGAVAYPARGGAILLWAPQPVDGMPERIATARRCDGQWIAFDTVSGLAVAKAQRTRKAAEADAVRTIEHNTPDRLAQALAAAKPCDTAAARTEWMKQHDIQEHDAPAPATAPDTAPAADPQTTTPAEAPTPAAAPLTQPQEAEPAEATEEAAAIAQAVIERAAASSAPALEACGIECSSQAQASSHSTTTASTTQPPSGAVTPSTTHTGSPPASPHHGSQGQALNPHSHGPSAPSTPANPAPCFAPSFDPQHTSAAEVRSWPSDQLRQTLAELEAINHHTEALTLQALAHGTQSDQTEAREILRQHQAAGYLRADLAHRAAVLRDRLRRARLQATPSASPAPQTTQPTQTGQTLQTPPAPTVPHGQPASTATAQDAPTATPPATPPATLPHGQPGSTTSNTAPPQQPTPALQIGALSITLERWEGLAEECGPPVTVGTFAQADATLHQWSNTAPESGGYNKCGFNITWPDGSTYEGRFDLVHHSIERASLRDHIAGQAEYWLGSACPMHSSEAQYLQHISRASAEDRALWEHFLQLLTQHAGYFPRARPVSVGSLAAIAHHLMQGPADLVGLGVSTYHPRTGSVQHGAITEAQARAVGSTPRVLAVVTYEDGSTEHIEDDAFEDHDHSHRARRRLNMQRHGAPYLAQLAAAKATRHASAQAAQTVQAQAHAAQLQALRQQYPQLTPAPNQHAGGKHAAINARVLLKQAYPGVRFSVRSDYNCLRVSWTDGPTTEQVDATLAPFNCGQRSECGDYTDHVHTAWGELFGSVTYLFTSREFSDATLAQVLQAHYSQHPNPPTVADYRAGRLHQFDTPGQELDQTLRHTLRQTLWHWKAQP